MPKHVPSPFACAAACGAMIMMLTPMNLRAEDGSKLWLRYSAGADFTQSIRQINVAGQSPTLEAIRKEITVAVEGLSGTAPDFVDAGGSDGVLIVGTPASSPAIASLNWSKELEALGREGFIIRSTPIDGRRTIVIASQNEIGALYGTFHFLRLLQNGGITDTIDIAQRPRVQLRLLNHWDNLDGSIERGYAGRSLWKWDELPAKLDPRYIVYARANASIGINGAVLNNVNAKPQSLSREYLEKAAALASAWRPLRHPRLPLGQLFGAEDARQPADRRPARPARRQMVEGEGGRDLSPDPRLRRVRRQGQLRRPARPAGLPAHARRRRQRARRCASRRTAVS